MRVILYTFFLTDSRLTEGQPGWRHLDSFSASWWTLYHSPRTCGHSCPGFSPAWVNKNTPCYELNVYRRLFDMQKAELSQTSVACQKKRRGVCESLEYISSGVCVVQAAHSHSQPWPALMDCQSWWEYNIIWFIWIFKLYANTYYIHILQFQNQLAFNVLHVFE